MTDINQPDAPAQPTLDEVRAQAKALVDNLDPNQQPPGQKPDRNTVLQERNQEYQRGLSLIRADHGKRRASFEKEAKEKMLLARVAFDEDLEYEIKTYQSAFEGLWPKNLLE